MSITSGPTAALEDRIVEDPCRRCSSFADLSAMFYSCPLSPACLRAGQRLRVDPRQASSRPSRPERRKFPGTWSVPVSAARRGCASLPSPDRAAPRASALRVASSASLVQSFAAESACVQSAQNRPRLAVEQRGGLLVQRERALGEQEGSARRPIR